MDGYKGMRWFKCDLQMQTPADAANWRGTPMAQDEEGMKAAADAYVRRCHEVGLEVIAITDHNFASHAFIPYLKSAIQSQAATSEKQIKLFPGFEFEANVGKGVHVLALFELDSDLNKVDHVLTSCGVAYPRVKDGVLAKSTRGLAELLAEIQQLDNAGIQRGIVILPHAMAYDGIFDNNRISQWLQQIEFLNPHLLAIEVPRPVNLLNESFQKLFAADATCLPEWRRSRPIACVMSSDNKALTPDECPNNYIGKRHTWIKMSLPSVEALRQAFLDHPSRIRLQEDRPSSQEQHPRIVSISIKGASFLDEQTVDFSSNLNCVIGGRGSGKSTLLEYLRFCLQPRYLDVVDRDLHEKLSAIRATVETAGAVLKVSMETAPGVLDTVAFDISTGLHAIEGRDVYDFDVALDQLGAQFFSQGELSRLSKPGGSSQVLRLIDSSCDQTLGEIGRSETTVRGELNDLFGAVRQVSDLNVELQRGKQELEELVRQSQARLEIQEDAKEHRRAQQAKQHIKDVVQTARNYAEALKQVLDEPDALMRSREVESEWPHAEWFRVIDERLHQRRESLTAELKTSVDEYVTFVSQLFVDDPQWPAIKEELKAADSKFRTACEQKGLLPEDVTKLSDVDRQRTSKQTEVDTLARRIAVLEAKAVNLPGKLSELHELWERQFKARSSACDSIRDKGPGTVVSISYMGDYRSFSAAWEKLAPRDSRTRVGRAWEEIGKKLFRAFLVSDSASPWALLQEWIEVPSAVILDVISPLMYEEFVGYLEDPDVRSNWERTRLTRVDDLVDVELLRADGTSVGKMSGEGGNGLSEGQRNTALLTLILAQGRGPIIIDQPEDELDSNYIFSDLVPLLRQAKEKRQLILATHNANLPVNADAELIYAFDALHGRGACRAAGGLDRPDVTLAVLDIMEGSEKAFKQRSEKYHF